MVFLLKSKIGLVTCGELGVRVMDHGLQLLKPQNKPYLNGLIHTVIIIIV